MTEYKGVPYTHIYIYTYIKGVRLGSPTWLVKVGQGWPSQSRSCRGV